MELYDIEIDDSLNSSFADALATIIEQRECG